MKIVTASPTQVPHQGLHLAGENNNPFVVPSSIPTMDTLNFSQFSQGHAGLSFWYMKNISYFFFCGVCVCVSHRQKRPTDETPSCCFHSMSQIAC
mmetsp:Transcript_38653/g.56431  ORF Transcript_38653/g.56431 Transcript_38653/m.56431 type:complete len:95 (+) Transcript_38653:484-768(+)